MDREAMNKKISKVIAKAWADADFKARLLANPAETLQAEGIEVPAGVKVNAVENTNEQFFLVLPKAPDELSDEQLDNVAGGFRCDYSH
ncbi:MAG: NHLP leader peptide family RiPP precursor [Syntrophomonas sp.]|nr:NHLP leader peptide family RiPP precursor [Syntrophomonas sp.]